MSADKTNTTFTKIFTDRDNRNNEFEEVSFIVAISWPYRGCIVAIAFLPTSQEVKAANKSLKPGKRCSLNLVSNELYS